jgi:hypothetical protein
MRDPQGQLQQIFVRVNNALSQVDMLLVGLENGEGTAGKLLKDPAIAEGVKELLSRMDGVVVLVSEAIRMSETILSDIKKATTVLPEAADTIRGELRSVPGVVLKTQTILHESEKLIEGLQAHWLLRGYMQEDRPLGAVPIDAIQMGGSSQEVSQ